MRVQIAAVALAALTVTSPGIAGKSSTTRQAKASTATTTRVATAPKQTTTTRVATTARQTTTTRASNSTAAPTRSSGRKKQRAASASPAANGQSNGSTVAIISGACDSLTDGDSSGCSFTGNINTNTNGNASFLLAETAYNESFNPDIDLDPLFTADSSEFILGGTNFIDNGNGTFTFNLADNILLDYFAVKGSNEFTLFEYVGGLDNMFTFTSSNLSHVTFFGTNGGGGTGGETGAVPEPGTWAMMLLGFGLAGSSMRRGRKAKGLAQLA